MNFSWTIMSSDIIVHGKATCYYVMQCKDTFMSQQTAYLTTSAFYCLNLTGNQIITTCIYIFLFKDNLCG